MFRDKDEELQRLQQELLAEEEPEDPQPQEDLLEEDLVDTLLDEDIQGASPQVYRNYSNDYGRQLRNYASGYKAYNADRTEEDPQALSEQLLEPAPRHKGKMLWVMLLLLLAAAAVFLLWLVLKKEALV